MNPGDKSEEQFLAWIREKTADALTEKINAEVLKYGEITPQTWKIAAYNIFKSVKDSKESDDVLKNIKDTIKREMHTQFSDTSQQKQRRLPEDRMCVSVLGTKQFQQMCRNLSHLKPLESRTQALKCLLHAHLPDSIPKECWLLLKRNLQHCLNEQNADVFVSSLKLHIKIISTTSHLFSKECYINLIETLHLQYVKKSKYLPIFENGLDLNDGVHKNIIRLAHTIIQIAKEISKKWVRFKDKWIEEVIGAFLLLATMHSTDVHAPKRCIFPIHLFSVLDPKASWCFQWLHGSLGRNIMFSMEKKLLILLKYVTETILSQTSFNLERQSYDFKHKITSIQLKEACLIHCINIFSIITAFQKGNNLFPIQTKIKTEPVTVPYIIIALIEYLNDNRLETSPRKNVITDAIITVMSRKNYMYKDNVEIMNTLMKPLIHVTSSQCLPSHNVQILWNLSKCEWHLDNFLGIPNHHRKSMVQFEGVNNKDENHLKEESPAKILISLITVELQSKCIVDTKILSMLTQIFVRLLSATHKIMLDILRSAVIPSAVSLLQRLTLNSADAGHSTELQELVRGLLVSVAGSPLGTFSLAQYEGVLPALVQSCPQTLLPVVSLGAPETLGQLEWTSSQLCCSFSLMASLAGVRTLLSESADKDKSLANLLSLSSEEESEHLRALSLLNGLLSYLNIWTYLETKFDLQNKLLQLQADSTVSSVVVVDECSLLRHHIVARSYVPGGPTERLSTHALQCYLEAHKDTAVDLPSALPTCLPTVCLVEQHIEPPSELCRVLEESGNGPRESQWLLLVRKAFRVSPAAGTKPEVLLQLVEEAAKCYKDQTVPTIDWTVNIERTLHPEEQLGVQLAIRYGQRLQALQGEQHEEALTKILKQGIPRNTESFQTFDWFSSSAYLLCAGNTERCIRFLAHFAGLPVAPFVWPALARHLGYSTCAPAIFCHLLGTVGSSEVPLAIAALKMAGVPWATVFCTWIGQSFWNVLDWPQICQWLALCSMYPPDVSVYFCIAILQHLQPHLLEASSSGKVWDCIQNPPLADFDIAMYTQFIEKTTKRHQTVTVSHLLEYTATKRTN